MKRDFPRLGDGPYDLLVIGGGIYGGWMAYDAALRGLNVALVEKKDWAAATSSASSKLIHGGLRYLEHGRLGLVRKSLDERRRLVQLAPHRVRPLRFVLPVYAGDRVGPMRLRIGLWLYDHLAEREPGVGRREFLKPHDLLQRYDLRSEGLKGAFVFGDCQTDDARFTLEIVDGAIEAGTVAVNRARATALLMEGRRVVGASVEDEETGEKLEVRAAVTANCTGAWSRELVEPFDGPESATRLTKGVHLIMPPLPVDEGFLLPTAEDRRVVFLIPWYGRTLLGTTDTDFDGDPDDVRVETADIRYLLARANRVLRGVPWRESDVVSSFAGLRTLPAVPNRSPSAVSREWSLVEPLDCLLTPIGGKYTSARADAAVAVDRVMRLLERDSVPCPTADRPFPWSPGSDLDSWNRQAVMRGLHLGLDEETIESLQLRYGSRLDRIYDRIRESPELAVRVVPEAPFCRAEIVHAVTDEMARTLEDVLRRRVPLLLLCRLPERTIREFAAVIGGLLGWSEQRREAEIQSLLDRAEAAIPVHETA